LPNKGTAGTEKKPCGQIFFRLLELAGVSIKNQGGQNVQNHETCLYGQCTETLERVSWNVSQFMGRTAQIRLVDASSGGWGHLNFDDLRFE
jgi:hypothetical protein